MTQETATTEKVPIVTGREIILLLFMLQAAILQQTAEYIYQLEQEKTQLLSQNCQLKRLVNQHEGGDVPIKKRKPDTQGNSSSIFNLLYKEIKIFRISLRKYISFSTI